MIQFRKILNPFTKAIHQLEQLAAANKVSRNTKDRRCIEPR